MLCQNCGKEIPFVGEVCPWCHAPKQASQHAHLAAANDFKKIIPARQAIAGLLISQRLVHEPHSDVLITLGKPLKAFFAGGGGALPVTMTQDEVEERRRKIDSKNTKGAAAGQVPSAKWIYDELSRFVIGQHELKRALAVAGWQILLRREAKRQKRKGPLPPKPNIAIISASGSGKSLACRILSQILQIPTASIDASQITASGYIGDDLSSVLFLVSQSAAAMTAYRKSRGLCGLSSGQGEKIGDKANGESVVNPRP